MMNYDEAIQQAEAIVSSLEKAEALSVSEYQQKASEVKRLLDLCESQILAMKFKEE